MASLGRPRAAFGPSLSAGLHVDGKDLGRKVGLPLLLDDRQAGLRKQLLDQRQRPAERAPSNEAHQLGRVMLLSSSSITKPGPNIATIGGMPVSSDPGKAPVPPSTRVRTALANVLLDKDEATRGQAGLAPLEKAHKVGWRPNPNAALVFCLRPRQRFKKRRVFCDVPSCRWPRTHCDQMAS